MMWGWIDKTNSLISSILPDKLLQFKCRKCRHFFLKIVGSSKEISWRCSSWNWKLVLFSGRSFTLAFKFKVGIFSLQTIHIHFYISVWFFDSCDIWVASRPSHFLWIHMSQFVHKTPTLTPLLHLEYEAFRSGGIDAMWES